MAAPNTEPWLEISASREFPSWLAAQRISLALTTYQAGKLLLIGSNPAGTISIFERTFNRCMGLWADGQTLWLSTLFQLWRMENVLAPGSAHQGYDRLYVPRVGYTTGDLDVHDVAVDAGGRVVFLATKFNCLATLHPVDNFAPLWRPPFIDRLVGEDRCHLNGLALVNGQPRYASLASATNVIDGWRDRRRNGGQVLEVPSGQVVVSGLSMPHSPRWYRDRLWLLEGGSGWFGYVDQARQRFEPVTFCPGFLRGLAFHGSFAFVGLSLPRHDKTFGGLALDDNLARNGAEPRCGLMVINLDTGTIVNWIRIEGQVSELYDVAVLPGVQRPMALGFKSDEIQRLITCASPVPVPSNAPAPVPSDAERGLALLRQGQHAEAARLLQQAIAARPGDGPTGNHLGAALLGLGRLEEAQRALELALSWQPENAEALNNLAAVRLAQGRADEAMPHYSRARQIAPSNAALHSNALYASQYLPGVTAADLMRSHAEWQECHAARYPADPPRAVGSGRPLRLGFISGDLRRHPVGTFLIRPLENLDRGNAEVICYADRSGVDEMTRRLRAAATVWRETWRLDDAALADQVRADAIDVLFDLAGHTAGNRLPVFARRPAPVQITWIGYPGTTGLTAMDYLLADARLVPEGEDASYSEKVLRLPDGAVCFDPPGEAPTVTPLPAQANGFVTFGCLNNPAKLNAGVLELWAKLLRLVPGSRLRLQYRGLDDPPTAAALRGRFAGAGGDPECLQLAGGGERSAILAGYQQVDLALDPFPYGGGLTTCEALWMGVPVITSPGPTFASRHAASHLTAAGLAELIAADHDDYLKRAADLAADQPALARLRQELRPRLAASPLCDGQRFARHWLQILQSACSQPAS